MFSKGKMSVLMTIFCLLGVKPALSDGTETLGAPSIEIVDGDDIVVAGAGLLDGPATIFFDVPGTIEQVLLYWEGESKGDPDTDDIDGDETIEVNGISVTGELIGGPINVVLDRYTSAYRADITSLGLVVSGSNALDISGLDISTPHGAGVAVIYNKSAYTGEVLVIDGNDLALSFREPITSAQTFVVQPSTNDRIAKLSFFASGVAGDTERLGFRPSAVNVTIGGNTTVYDNILDSVDGPHWDTITLEIVIPAFEESVTVTLESVDNLDIGTNPFSPASFTWTFASLSVEVEQGCRYYKKHHKKHHGHKSRHKKHHGRFSHHKQGKKGNRGRAHRRRH